MEDFFISMAILFVVASVFAVGCYSISGLISWICGNKD